MGLQEFIRSERGATTVDWVVLTGGITGLGLATMAVVTGGVENLAGDVDAALIDYEIATEFAAFVAGQLTSNDFSGGVVGEWTGGTVGNMGGSLGELLMVGAGQTASLQMEIPPGASQATFTFDLIGGDSLDDETATVMINGQPVTIATGNHGNISFADQGMSGVTVSTNTTSQGTQLGGSMNPGWNDSVTTVSITVDNPGDTLTLGVRSGTNQSLNDEYYGIDNVSVDVQ